MKKVIIILLILCSITVFSQNRVQFTNHSNILSFFNPAFTGNDKALNITLLARQQWIGYENAPSTQTIIFDTYFEKIKSGIGITVLNDKLGYENTTKVNINYSYKYFISGSTSFSAGISGGIMNSNFDAVSIVYEEFDPNGIYNSLSSFMPDINAGIMVTRKLFTLGISVSKTYDNLKDDIDILFPYYIHTYTDYILPVTNSITLHPSLYWQKTTNISTYDAGTSVILNDKVWVGITYRFKESVNGMIGYRINEKIKVGYSYDNTINSLRTYNKGSHEIFLKVTFKKPEEEYFYFKSPRYF